MVKVWHQRSGTRVSSYVPKHAPLSNLMQSEHGGMLVWSLMTIIGILMAVGLGIDTMRTETMRTHMQNTLDRAVLAAADLENTQTPNQVVTDFFDRAKLPSEHVNIQATASATEKVVSANISANVGAMLIDMIGKDTLPARASGEARESITDVEISLVLDNSGSMGWDNNRRLDLLKPAATNFVDMVMQPGPNGEPTTVSLSLIPFSTQVNAGTALGGALSYSSEHTYSYCAEFAPDAYSSAALNPTAELRRGGHFDVFTWSAPVTTFGVVCPFDTSRQITAFSQDADALKAQIEAMWAGGNTSIDIAAKWGAALLDPAFQPVVTSMISSGDASASVTGRPYGYTRADTLKVLVVMSDGQNTQEYQLRDAYRSGPSPVWRDPASGRLSYFDEDQGSYFAFNGADISAQPGGVWQGEPVGADAAVNLPWTEVWANWSVAVFARDIKDQALGGGWQSHYNAVFLGTNASDKNLRASAICQAARDAGIVVYTVGMDTYGQGDATLEDCAGTPLNFFDVNAEEIDEAFSAIARQINLLRLTQ